MEQQPSLFTRIGGNEAIAPLVDEFYLRIMGDEELAPFFEKSSMEHIRGMQREFLTVALGGDPVYQGRPLAHVHHGRGIKPHHFNLFIKHLGEVLRDHGIAGEEMNEVITHINTYVDEIVGSGSGVDG